MIFNLNRAKYLAKVFGLHVLCKHLNGDGNNIEH